MRAKKNEPGNPVKDVAGMMGQIEPEKFPFEPKKENEIIEGLKAVEPSKPGGAFEIAPGMTVEEMTALFFDKALIEPPYKVYQLNSKGHRYYYRYDGNCEPEFYPSVTTILSQTLPQSPFLVKWIAEKGMEEAERYKNERAAYGTFMHAQFEALLIARAYDLDELRPKLKAYIEQQNLPDDFIFYADDLKKDVLAFAQFVLDYDVKPLAVEIALVHPDFGFAGCIDMPCNMQIKPGSDTRINAIVDFKSGRKGFFEEHEIQLHLYRMMWNANFPDCQIERVYNFSPKDWRKRPSYNFKDQTDSPSAKKIPALLELAAIEDERRDNMFTAVSGVIALDNAPDLGDNIVSLTLSELVKKKAPKEKQPGKEIAVTVEDLTAEIVPKTPEIKQKQPKIVPKTPEIKQKQPETIQSDPEPGPKKTNIVKRTTTKETTKAAKTQKKTENNPDKAKATSKRVITPKTEEKPAKAKEMAKSAAKTNLLNDEPEI